jgi:hypothetical protein
LAKIGELKSLNVFDPVDDPATDFDEGRAFALAAPAFGGSMGNAPPAGQFFLRETSDRIIHCGFTYFAWL